MESEALPTSSNNAANPGRAGGPGGPGGDRLLPAVKEAALYLVVGGGQLLLPGPKGGAPLAPSPLGP